MFFTKSKRPHYKIIPALQLTAGLCAWLFTATACSSHQGSSRMPESLRPTQVQPNRQGSLKKLIDFRGMQVTGITATDDGRLFANFPRWRQGLPFSVVEVMADGSYRPYPNAEWNKWIGEPRENAFTCVQSVVAKGSSLFVLDPSNPEMNGVVGHPTLFEFDLKTNNLKQKWQFRPQIAPSMSYLNDLRIDDDGRTIYMTDSGLGALVILDRVSGKSWRVLDQDPSTKTEPITLQIAGRPFVKPSGSPQRMNSDGIALFDGYLYYHALTGYHLYRVPTNVLKNPAEAAGSIAAAVEDLGLTPAPDGMIFDRNGNLYMADLEKQTVVYRTPAGEMRTLVQDPTLHWPDTFTIDRNNQLLFTDSQLDDTPPRAPVGDKIFSVYQVPLAD